ncbi:PREDICTED: B-cell linker protein isoform X5 [Elephantulus edwardii]|uniref:B-cell linker protein isoform X5 n=1 Tax=Elephantulus edwardii TaxID=28737 RepID=UPI0003F0E9BB|nr:PREDICTED: B-cell linker protein isoform X5 [Elephantulus edwardii]
MEKILKITFPSSRSLSQLQKMVHDIKNNEGGIMNKIKKLKGKAPPSVPQRDYASGCAADEEDQWSDDFDNDYENPDEHSDSEMYVMPAEENGDDSYEPPPAEQEMRMVHPALPFARGEYVGRNSGIWESTLPCSPVAPCPLPRAGKKPIASLKAAPITSQQNASSACEGKPIPAERHRASSHRQEAGQSPVLTPVQKQIHQKPIPLPRFPEGGSPTVEGQLPNFTSNFSLSEQEADVHCKPWYAGACDRKSAEEALYKSNKYFGSVAEIIKNHQHSPLVLIDSQNNTKDSTRLKYAVKI